MLIAANNQRLCRAARRVVEGADLDKGEWDPNWTRHNKAVVEREPKGTIRERVRAERVKKIEDAMENMQQRIVDMHAARISGKAVSNYDRQLREAGVIKDKSAVSKEQKEEEKMRLKKEAKTKKDTAKAAAARKN
jgi:hypothetical protein